MDISELKNILYQKCLEWLENKIDIAGQAMKNAQEAANNEEKSSAGDKYETGRAMSQNERDMYARQLAECIRQKQLLLSTDISLNSDKVLPGSLVSTATANYFICISAGNLTIDGTTYFVVSPDTPVAKLLLGKQVGESFVFNWKEQKIHEVC